MNNSTESLNKTSDSDDSYMTLEAMFKKADQDSSNHRENKRNPVIDGHSSEPTQPNADIFYIFESFNETPAYIPATEVIGRPIPHVLIFHGLAEDMVVVSSDDADMSFQDGLYEAVDLIQEHYDEYGAMFTQDVFDDLAEFDNLQSGMFLPHHSPTSTPKTMPIMGVPALSIALKRLKSAADEPYTTAGNLLSLDSFENDDNVSFQHTLIGHGSLGPKATYRNEMGSAVYSLIEEDGYDYYDDFYPDMQAGIHINAKMNCPAHGETLSFKSTVTDTPFQFLGFSEIPTMWTSILMSHYAGPVEFKKAYDTTSKYQDVFFFWLAAASGMPLSNFRSLIDRTSDFHDLSRDEKADVLKKIAVLVDDAALPMQNDDFLETSPLINIYD